MVQLGLDWESAGLKRPPPPDFSGCFQFDPEERTAKAAAKRKAISPRPLHSSYVADLNGYRVTQNMLRHPAGPPLPKLVKRGTIVKTSYDTGPYVVTAVCPHTDYGVETYSLVCCGADGPRGQYHLNELVAVDGRVLHLFLANEDEVFIIDDYPTPPGCLF